MELSSILHPASIKLQNSKLGIRGGQFVRAALLVLWVLNFPYSVSYINLSFGQPIYGLVFCVVCITYILDGLCLDLIP